jgi:hypothetical protein
MKCVHFHAIGAKMREILADLEALRSPDLRLADLQMDGISFGATTDCFPRQKISEVTFSAIVARQRGGPGKEAEYFDSAGRKLEFEEVVESVIIASGIVHFPSRISYKIADARVVGFALYGDHLRHFRYVTSYDEFCAAFGPPDRVIPYEADGDLFGYDHYYFRAQKHVAWDEFGLRVSLINLGAYPGNNGEEIATSVG